MDLLKLEIPINGLMASSFSLYEMTYDIKFLYPFVIDSTGFFKQLILTKYGNLKQEIVIESSTRNENSLMNIQHALESGSFLIIEDFDVELLNMVLPIIE